MMHLTEDMRNLSRQKTGNTGKNGNKFFEINSTSSLWGFSKCWIFNCFRSNISQGEVDMFLSIPNQEVEKEFQNLTACYFKSIR